MRDDLVDKMVEKIEVETPDSVTSGLADLFEVLEAMKLVRNKPGFGSGGCILLIIDRMSPTIKSGISELCSSRTVLISSANITSTE